MAGEPDERLVDVTQFMGWHKNSMPLEATSSAVYKFWTPGDAVVALVTWSTVAVQLKNKQNKLRGEKNKVKMNILHTLLKILGE